MSSMVEDFMNYATAELDMSQLSFVCVYCRSFMSSPEELCQHMLDRHEIYSPVEEQEFDDSRSLEKWLSRVEEDRTDAGIVEYDGANSSHETDYYILCQRRTTPHHKRRRLMRHNEENDEDHIVTCTAFIHVEELADGSYLVRYCLDHSEECDANGEDDFDEPRPFLKHKRNMKRNSDCMSSNDSSPSASPKSHQIIARKGPFDMFSNNNNAPVTRKMGSTHVSPLPFLLMGAEAPVTRKMGATVNPFDMSTLQNIINQT